MEKKTQQILKKVSFITTIFNEEKTITNFLKSLFEQNFLPEEIIVVDGGSKDNTLENIYDFLFKKAVSQFVITDITEKHDLNIQVKNEKILKVILFKAQTEIDTKNKDKTETDSGLIIKIISSPGSRISEGRNIAISHARNEIICGSDGGCSLDKNWLYEISKGYFEDKRKSDVTGGFSHPVALTFLEKLLEVCIMPEKKEIDPKKFMPSSRNISFLKNAWAEVGGYPQDLDYGEDMRFNFNLVEKGFRIAFNPDAIVYWRMRENLILIFKQFFRYAKGDAIGKMYTYRHLARFVSMIFFIAIILVSVYLSPWFLIIFIPLLLLYVHRPYTRISNSWRHIKGFAKRSCFKILTALLVPFMLVFIDTAKALGYIFGKFKGKV